MRRWLAAMIVSMTVHRDARVRLNDRALSLKERASDACFGLG
jgi:hypothetical protein